MGVRFLSLEIVSLCVIISLWQEECEKGGMGRRRFGRVVVARKVNPKRVCWKRLFHAPGFLIGVCLIQVEMAREESVLECEWWREDSLWCLSDGTLAIG
ncbi:hypothetical protein E3N88_01255 [Mikania micrantha]|uniref:Secreted protein n=1 Tax=Mikania micrantha TaxID=192012 RepID=A0A5N6Q0L5_9ASTR|nr:hypothetical protein E3N88_01255 [Mikania micrantha]